MAGLMLVGLVAYKQLPVSALPQVDYPTIQVLTFIRAPGPDVMVSSVTAPLERQFGQVPGLKQMTSTSTFGASLVILQFDLDQNIDVAEQQVQAAINAAARSCRRSAEPSDLQQGESRRLADPDAGPEPTAMPLQKVEDLADTTLAQKIAQLPGVGLVTISGGQKPAVRVQANPTALASYGLSLEDMRTALAAANVDQAKGKSTARARRTRSARTIRFPAADTSRSSLDTRMARRSVCRTWPAYDGVENSARPRGITTRRP